MKRHLAALGTTAVAALLLTGCTTPTGGGNGNTTGPLANLGSSLTCDASPTEADLLAYDVPKAKEKYNIALMQVSSAGYYYQGIDNGADLAAEEAGITLTKFSADGYASPDLQLKQVQDAMLRGADAIVIAPSDIQGSVPVVEAAREAGLPVVNISSEVASDDVHMVMQDDYTFGQLAADRIATQLGDKGGKGIIVAGPANATWSQRRTEGFTDRVKDSYPNIQIVAAPTQDVDPAAGLRSFEDAVQANPDIDWVFAVHYYILQPASLPDDYRGEVLYVAGGLEPDSITGLQDGSLDSVFGLAPRWMGRLGVGYAVSMLNGDEMSRVTCVPIPLFTKDDVDSPFAKQELIP
jgi:ribose transport system substrate-binding protein